MLLRNLVFSLRHPNKIGLNYQIMPILLTYKEPMNMFFDTVLRVQIFFEGRGGQSYSTYNHLRSSKECRLWYRSRGWGCKQTHTQTDIATYQLNRLRGRLGERKLFFKNFFLNLSSSFLNFCDWSIPANTMRFIQLGMGYIQMIRYTGAEHVHLTKFTVVIADIAILTDLAFFP